MSEHHEPEYHGARFYKCALQVNPFAYAKRHGKDPGAPDEATYNTAMARACIGAGVSVVALANHGDVDESESLRKILRANGITVFPGFEIASAEKIHMVCFFPEDTELAVLNGYLGAASGGNYPNIKDDPSYPSGLVCLDIAAKIEGDRGVWYAPHMDGKDGILEKKNRGVWKSPHFMAGYLTEDIKDVDSGIRDIIENNDPQYERDRRIAVINANDVYNPAHLDKPRSVCWIKMAMRTVDSVRQAFFDHESRVSLGEPPKPDFSHIQSIQWNGGGFFQNNAVKFSPHLNAVIGGRGTGKSSFLESIRHALTITPVGDEAKRLSEDIVRNNLADSQVTVRVWSHTQKECYDISRRYGEQACVKVNGEISSLRMSDILPGVDVLGQNEILEISSDEQKVRGLLERFLPSGAGFAEKSQQISDDLKANRVQLLQLEDELEAIKLKTSGEESLIEQLNKLKTVGIEEKAEKWSRVLEERRLCENLSVVEGDIRRWLAELDDIADSLPTLPDALDKFPNAGILAEIRQQFVNCINSATSGRDAMLQSVESLSTEFARQRKLLEENWSKLQDEMDVFASQMPAQNGASGGDIIGQYRRLCARIDDVNRAKEEGRKKKDALEKIRAQRKNLLEDYRQHHFSRFVALRATAKKLNEEDLKGTMHIGIERMRIREKLRDFITLNAKGVGASGMQWLGKTEEVDTVAMAGRIRASDADGFLQLFPDSPPTRGIAEKIVKMSRADAYELEEVAIDDRVVVSLNLAGAGTPPDFRPLDKLSTGQKCTAILELFLLDRQYPLVLDQPEDHLDNAFITEHVAARIREKKHRCQLILSTHNANIPVFGDAELIAVLETNENRQASIRDECLGSIDKPAVKDRVALILDGGEKAFKIRKEKYGY